MTMMKKTLSNPPSAFAEVWHDLQGLATFSLFHMKETDPPVRCFERSLYSTTVPVYYTVHTYPPNGTLSHKEGETTVTTRKTLFRLLRYFVYIHQAAVGFQFLFLMMISTIGTRLVHISFSRTHCISITFHSFRNTLINSYAFIKATTLLPLVVLQYKHGLLIFAGRLEFFVVVFRGCSCSCGFFAALARIADTGYSAFQQET